MLDEFLTTNRAVIIARTQARVAARSCPKPTPLELTNGVPAFLDQLGDALRLARSTDQIDHQEIGESAGRHGQDLLRNGLSIAQVVRDYGDICQVVTQLAVEQRAPISGDEFRTLNLCLDDAIAEAVTAYARQSDRALEARASERLGLLARDLRYLLDAAMLSFESIRSGAVAVGGSTGVVLARSLIGLRELIDRSLADVRLDAGTHQLERVCVAEFIEEIEIGALMQARARGLQLAVMSVDRAVIVEADRQVLAAALSNLLNNAFKFTRKRGSVALKTRVTADRVLFEVEDECGGLSPGDVSRFVRPLEQGQPGDRAVGLGLTVCLKAAKASAGEIHVRNLPGKGCVFTLALPRSRRSHLTPIDGSGPAAGEADRGDDATGSRLRRRTSA